MSDLLQRRRDIVKSDLSMKLEIEDWHGVADAAMDLREIDTEIRVRGIGSQPLNGRAVCPKCGMRMILNDHSLWVCSTCRTY